jgi:hypothetical protein
MTEAECLKLVALDDEDLAVISAHVQDAVLKVADLVFLPRENRFAVAMNRFSWEKSGGERRNYERCRTALIFDRVLSVKTTRIRRDREDAVLELLAVQFETTEAPAGFVDLFFAGGGVVRLEVECIEARLADLGVAWTTAAMPKHDLDSEEAKSSA